MPELKKIPVILDGDPGHDDAIAWVLARASRQLDILAVTSCFCCWPRPVRRSRCAEGVS